MNKPTYNGMTRCFVKKDKPIWDDQKICELKGAEKSRFRKCCIYLSINGYKSCSNPEAGKKRNGGT